MKFSDYQQAAMETSQLNLGGPQGAIGSMLGLASETGSILNVYKKYLRDGIDLAANVVLLREELGDLLWYTAAIATAFGLNMDDIAEANLQKTHDRYLHSSNALSFSDLPVFDAEYPLSERFPRLLTIEFTEATSPTGRLISRMRLVHVEPNAFPDGPVVHEGKTSGFRVNATLGDPLSDNSRQSDAYRYHDAIHLGFMAVLGWSPNMRSLLRLKRRSEPMTDECEDGARAIFAEEGLAAVLSRLAQRRMGFLNETNIDGEVIEVAKAAAIDLEVEVMPAWLWRRAISQGFRAMGQLAANRGGYLIADLDSRAVGYEKTR